MHSLALDEDEDRHLWMGDLVHPSEKAYDVIARMIVKHAGKLV
jgi:lysophospholipase L1-like esterase